MSSPLQVVALISGGKDSLFSILHCLQNGHRVVALANLYPPAPPNKPDEDASLENKDMNSFMYQTVGHQVIPHYAEALAMPLYRRQIAGSAVQTGRYYNTSEENNRGDETEDLLELLQEVIKHHPDVNAVSSGAILSTYQRTRVESVAVRLGLVPLSYLWQYPALPPPPERPDSLTGLLDDMAAAGCDARIIKVASGGMKENLLWSNVVDPRTKGRLVSGMAPFFPGHEFWLRGAVLGEGGEYETLAVDGPSSLWKKRLIFDEHDIETVTEEGGVWHTRLGAATTAEKDDGTRLEAEASIRVPKLYDAQFEAVRARIPASFRDNQMQSDPTSTPSKPFPPEPAVAVSSTRICLCNIVAVDLKSDAAAQMRQIVAQVKATLHSIGPSLRSGSIVSVLLLLSSMSDFATINPVYASLFTPGEPNPPARVTIAVDLPAATKVSVSLIVSRCPQSQLRGLHVQSRSYWAPPNIGPYSQAKCEPVAFNSEEINVHDASQLEVVHIAGQIPLVPQSMNILEASFREQALLSLQHLWRIGQERDVDLWPWGIALLSSTDQAHNRAQPAYDVWLRAHVWKSEEETESDGDDEDQDVWFSQHDRFSGSNQQQISIGEHLYVLPNHAIIDRSMQNDADCPPFLAAEVISLPRDASIEWWSLGIVNISSNAGRASYKSESWPWGSADTLTVTTPSSEDHSLPTTLLFMAIFVSAPSDAGRPLHLSSIMAEMGIANRSGQPTVHQATVFLNQRSTLHTEALDRILGFQSSPAQIPCRHLWGASSSEGSHDRTLRQLDAALLLRLEPR